MDHIRPITHRQKPVLLVDLANCQSTEVELTVRRLPDIVNAKPRNSVLLLADFTGAFFDDEALRTIKESAVFIKAHVKRSAWLGADRLPASFREELAKFSRREFTIFTNRTAALDWLTED